MVELEEDDATKREGSRTPPSGRDQAGVDGDAVPDSPEPVISSEELLSAPPDVGETMEMDAAAAEAASIESAMAQKLDEYLRNHGKRIVGDMVKPWFRPCQAGRKHRRSAARHGCEAGERGRGGERGERAPSSGGVPRESSQRPGDAAHDGAAGGAGAVAAWPSDPTSALRLCRPRHRADGAESPGAWALRAALGMSRWCC